MHLVYPPRGPPRLNSTCPLISSYPWLIPPQHPQFTVRTLGRTWNSADLQPNDRSMKENSLRISGLQKHLLYGVQGENSVSLPLKVPLRASVHKRPAGDITAGYVGMCATKPAVVFLWTCEDAPCVLLQIDTKRVQSPNQPWLTKTK